MSNLSTEDATIKTPDEILKSRASLFNILIRKTIVDITTVLNADYMGEDLRITLDGDRRHYEKMMPELEKAFKNKGWNIEITKSFSNRNEPNTEFRLSAIIYPQPAVETDREKCLETEKPEE